MSDLHPERDSIVKSLLTSNTFLNLSSKMAISSSTMSGELSAAKTQYPSNSQAPSQNNSYTPYFTTMEKEQENISMDHSYARSFNGTHESMFSHLTKVLFMPTPTKRKRVSSHSLVPVQNSEEIIDIETVPTEADYLYDNEKAMFLMGECDRLATFAKVEERSDDWEESIPRLNWLPIQHTLFNGMVKILKTLHLARLAYMGTHHEPVSRRLAIDRAVKRTRRLFAITAWDTRILQWLYQLLIENLDASILSLYFDILQTLKVKLPTLVDKIMCAPNSHNRVGVLSNESLMHLFKRPWDPYSSYLLQNKPKKLPGNPILLIIPSTPNVANTNCFRRQHKWHSLFSNLATTVMVHTNIGASANRLTLTNCADQMLVSARSKLHDIKGEYPGRPIVLIGINAGSAIALQLALAEPLLCIVCLGFSVLTAEGRRGDPDDSLLEVQRPVLFVIGQCSIRSIPEDVESLRERMRSESSLLIVGGADDYLRISKSKKQKEGLTQSAIDRIISDNVGEFIGSVLMSPYQSQIRSPPTQVLNDSVLPKRMKTARNRQYSNGSSLDSEPPSPTMKLTRPVGRPPGSKSKSKLEAKWAAQIAQGIPSSSPSHSPPSSLSHTPDNSAFDNSNSKKVHDTDISKHTLDSSQQTSNEDTSISTSSSGSGTLPHLLQGPPRQTNLPSRSGIKVLENLSINPSSSPKIVTPMMNRAVDLSKITVFNSLNSQKGGMMVLADNKLKTGQTIKGIGSTPLVLPISNKNKLGNVAGASLSSINQRFPKYFAGKKQVMGRKILPPSSQKPSLVPFSSANLVPPTNLTTQDIMDLPIIFADDDQILTSDAKLQQSTDTSSMPPSEIRQVPKATVSSNPVGKFVFINKQIPYQGSGVKNATSTVVTATGKRPSVSFPVHTNPNAKDVRYTRIIISQPSSESVVQPMTATTSTVNVMSKIDDIPSSSDVKPKMTELALVPAPTDIDIENTLSASTIVKPGYIKLKRDDLEKEADDRLNYEMSPQKYCKREVELSRDRNEDSTYVVSKSHKS